MRVMKSAIITLFVIVGIAVATLSLAGIGTQASADQGDCYKKDINGNTHCTGTVPPKEPIRSCEHPNSLKDNDGDQFAGCNPRP